MSDRNRIAEAMAAQERMREIDEYNRIMSEEEPQPSPFDVQDPVRRQMLMSNEVLRTSPRVFDSYMQGVSMPDDDPRARAYRGMAR